MGFVERRAVGIASTWVWHDYLRHAFVDSEQIIHLASIATLAHLIHTAVAPHGAREMNVLLMDLRRSELLRIDRAPAIRICCVQLFGEVCAPSIE